MAAAPTLALNELVRSVKASSQNTSASIREHAQNQQGSMERMLKDLYKILNSNSRQTSSLSGAFNENVAETQQMSRKVDGTNNLLQQTLSIQSTMLTEMRALNSNFKNLSESLKTNLSGTSGGIVGGITETGRNILSALGIGATAAVAGGAAGYVAGKSSGSEEGGKTAAIPVTPNGGNADELADSVIKTIRQKESEGDYRAWNFTWPNGQNPNPDSTATGAYQFTAQTWQGLTKRFGVGQEYQLARDAPPEIQDQVARLYVKDILRRNNNDIRAVPREWYAGPKGYLTPRELAVNRGLTVEKYIEQWMNTHNRVNRSNPQTAQQPQIPTAPVPSQPMQETRASETSAPQIQRANYTPPQPQATVQPANLRPPGSPMDTQRQNQDGGRVFEDQMAEAQIRKGPISDRLKRVLQIAAAEAGVDVRVKSGGQPSSGGPRTGSDRHDNGNAADLDLYIGNRRLSPKNPEDLPIFKKFVATAKAEGATGIGAGEGYMSQDGSRLHVGFGDAAIWGADKSAKTAADWLREATGNVPSGGGGAQTAQMQPQTAPSRTDNMNQLDPLGMGGMPLIGAMAMPLGGAGGPLIGALSSLVQLMSSSAEQKTPSASAAYDSRVDGNMNDTNLSPSWFRELRQAYPTQGDKILV